ncbi:hypothetical protein H4R33_005320 [Dimargaris cristalligena]|nr:hypothetical protein H4R33_005320 [Dimargaris cristalligena]
MAASIAPIASQATKLTTTQQYAEFIDKFDTFLLDCDGKRILFVTNNSTKSREAYTVKFEKIGIHAKEEEIFGSAFATAVYLSSVSKLPEGKKAYVIGMDGIRQEFALQNIPIADSEEDLADMTDDAFATIKPDEDVGAVVIGFDTHINYRKYAKAFTLLTRVPDCRFIATNTDLTFPAAGFQFPGTGALVSVLSTSTGRQPTVIGKPHQTMLDCIVEKYHLDRDRTCMVGDRLDTDIQFGINGGISTLLVLSGVTYEHQLHTENPSSVPTYYMDSLGHLAKVRDDQ